MIQKELSKFKNVTDFSNILKESDKKEENVLNNYETFKCNDNKKISKSTPGKTIFI